jgi:hypothetical protein
MLAPAEIAAAAAAAAAAMSPKAAPLTAAAGTTSASAYLAAAAAAIPSVAVPAAAVGLMAPNTGATYSECNGDLKTPNGATGKARGSEDPFFAVPSTSQRNFGSTTGLCNRGQGDKGGQLISIIRRDVHFMMSVLYSLVVTKGLLFMGYHST